MRIFALSQLRSRHFSEILIEGYPNTLDGVERHITGGIEKAHHKFSMLLITPGGGMEGAPDKRLALNVVAF